MNAATSRPERVSAPRPPDAPAPSRFPLFATLAPVVASVALWAVTRSPFALAFAALGPVVAIAGVADARLQRRRGRRREAARFDHECVSTREALTSAHDREREELEQRVQLVPALIDSDRPSPARWRGSLDRELPVRLGRGSAASVVHYSDSSSITGVAPDALTASILRELSEFARVVTDAPLTADARRGVAFVGATPLVQAAARSVALQVALALSPAEFVIAMPKSEPSWGWLGELPHARAALAGAGRLEFTAASTESRSPGSGSSPHVVIAFARDSAQLPPGIATIIEIAADAGARMIDSASDRATAITPDFVSVEHAASAAMILREWAANDQLSSTRDLLPELVELSSLREGSDDGPPIDDGSGLTCTIGATATGPLRIDLVADGPHAVIGGTTGSGKSELLLSWVLSMASRRSPAEVTFLFVDFKGGASFDPLASLPHCVGLITDLDPHLADRALLSLGAELRFRERTLAEAGLRSIDDAAGATPFPRLVVLVDEYAALIESSPSLHAVFLDLAARGRSLGVHLVLCTQRPAGVVRDGILANSGLRISLRVTAAPDSTAVIGTAAAASLPARPRGRALLSVAGSDAVPFQVARSTDSDARGVTERWRDHSPPPRRPWCPPLAAVVRLSDLPGSSVLASAADIPFAMIDLPELQRQTVARYDPARHGSLAVIGTAGSGKTAALSALATGPSLLERRAVPRSLPVLWDVLGDATQPARERPSLSRVLLIDDIDSLLASCPDEYVSALVDRLSGLLRDGPALGVHVVLTAQRIPASLHSLLALCGSRILLRMPDRHEYIVAGGETAHFTPQLAPGGGHWRGHRIQVLWQPDAPPIAMPAAAVTIDPADGSPLAVVSTRPALALERLRRLAPDRTVSLLDVAGPGAPAVGDSEILVGDPESWQSNWGGVAALRATPVLFDGCSVAEFRAITRRRELPPLCAPGERAAWIVLPDGSVSRARLPPNPVRP